MSATATQTPETDDPPVGAPDLYEVVNGQIVEPPPMGVFESWVANVLNEAIVLHFATNGRLGRSGVELLFKIQTEPNLQRRPDLAFVSYERWPKDRPFPKTVAWQVVPDLAIEIVGPGDLAIEIHEKLDDYFRAGVRQVWVVYPRTGHVFVHGSPKSITVLDATDTLDGGEILSGFQVRLAELFHEAGGTSD